MSFSRIFFYFCLYFLGGVFVASFFNPFSSTIGFFILFFLLILGLAISIIFYKKDIAVFGLCLFVLLFGVFWEEKFEAEIIPEPEDIHFYNEKGEINFEGLILKEPEEKMKNTQIVVESQKIIDNEISVHGKVLVTLPRGVDFQYGDKIEITGKLQTPEKFAEDFDWPEYLRKERIYSTMYNPEVKKISSDNGNPLIAGILSLKSKLKNTAEILLPPEGALLSAMTLGDKTRISEKLNNDLSRAGLSHMVAISGLHIMVLFGILLSCFLWIGCWRKEATIFTILFLIFYILMIGVPSSAIRAGVMGGLLYLGMAFGRLNQSSRAITFAATGMVISNPLILTRDVGFQLSFLASLGLIYLLPILKEKWQANDSELKNLICTTLAAQAFCLPILIYNFGKISILSPLSNILVVPLLPYVLGGSFLFLILGTIFSPIAFSLSFIIWLPYAFIVKILEIISVIPFSAVSFKIPIFVIFLCYTLLFYFVAKWSKKKSYI
ncbi:MAG TPA: ComEC/Rec2 family competence protein [Candidatus Pacearchaeota archaeon]|nr:ComEC/Rec2 family competence protein [Candidatus Pacearchaeota archaeon]HOK94389.1 ComEC/Rec2 family competence protein [Candidatus Pacearchaeota archaeon]HPO75272.1 ComEC/Rec2 family competence protein [Candidatus Pacearchaeota archaeon]